MSQQRVRHSKPESCCIPRVCLTLRDCRVFEEVSIERDFLPKVVDASFPPAYARAFTQSETDPIPNRTLHMEMRQGKSRYPHLSTRERETCGKTSQDVLHLIQREDMIYAVQQ